MFNLSVIDNQGNETVLFDEITAQSMFDTIFKKDGSVFKSIPKRYSPLERYILRIAQFASGVNSHMPVTADWDLKDYCTSKNVPFRYVGADASRIRKHIDGYIISLMTYTKNDQGLDLWVKALS